MDMNMNKIIFRLIAVFAISLFCLQSKTVQAQIVPNAQIYGKKEYYQGEEIVEYALKFLGNPYRYGGNSLTKGIDCSHFVWNVLRNTAFYEGKYLTSQKWKKVGQKISSLGQAKAGDIIIYSHHVAIYDGKGFIIEARNRKYGITANRKADHGKILGIRRFKKIGQY